MKKIVVSIIAAGCFILSATAQDVNSHNHCHHQKNSLVKQLNLTADQQKQLAADHTKIKAEMIALNKDESMTVKDYRDKKFALKKEQKVDFMAILTPDQKAKLTQLKQDQKIKMQAMADKRLDKMKTELNLSNEQVAAIKANRQATMAKKMAVLQNNNLNRTDEKTQLTAIRAADKDSMQTVLTADQYTKWQALQKEKMDRMPERMDHGISQ